MPTETVRRCVARSDGERKPPVSGSEVLIVSALLVAHYVGDFSPLATAGMQRAKANGGPLLVIAGHAGVHGVLVALVATIFAAPGGRFVFAAALIVFVTHFALDAAKARLGRRFPLLNAPQNKEFWYVLGLDQLGHALVLVGLTPLIT